MKRIITFAFALFLFIFPVSAQQDNGITLGYTEGLTLCTPDSIPSSGGKIFGMDEGKFNNYLTENGILLYGFDNGNAFVFELTGEKTDFTESIKDFANIDEEDIKAFADSTLTTLYSVENISGTEYIVTDSAFNDEKAYMTRQYITVKHGLLYVITFTVPSSSVNKDVGTRIDKIVNSLSFGREAAPKKVSALSVIGVAVLAVLTAAFAVYCLITIVKDIRKRKTGSDEV